MVGADLEAQMISEWRPHRLPSETCVDPAVLRSIGVNPLAYPRGTFGRRVDVRRSRRQTLGILRLWRRRK